MVIFYYCILGLYQIQRGIPEEEIKHIFEPLYTNKSEGTGLGLSTVKNLVEQHQGRKEFKNNPTTFTIKLPKSLNTS